MFKSYQHILKKRSTGKSGKKRKGELERRNVSTIIIGVALEEEEERVGNRVYEVSLFPEIKPTSLFPV